MCIRDRYGLGKKEAAAQLASDFGLAYEDWKPPGRARTVSYTHLVLSSLRFRPQASPVPEKGAFAGTGEACGRNRRLESTVDRGAGRFEEAAGHPLLGTDCLLYTSLLASR